jgi:hypothetical protein
MGDDESIRPTETTAANPPTRPVEPPEVFEKGWDLVDPTPPPKAQASPQSPPSTSAPAEHEPGGGDDGGASGD